MREATARSRTAPSSSPGFPTASPDDHEPKFFIGRRDLFEPGNEACRFFRGSSVDTLKT